MKLQKRFSIIMVSLLIIVAITSILISRNISTNIIKQQITNNLINTTQSRAKNIETLLSEYEELTKIMATGTSYRDAVDGSIDHTRRLEKVNQRIKTIIQTHEEISRICVLDKEGIVIISSDEDAVLDKSALEIFLEGKEGSFIGDLHLSSLTRKYGLSVSTPILLDNQFAGILIINFNADKKLFKITTDHTGLGETGEVYLVNKDGYMITPSRFIDEVILKQKVELGDIKETIANESSATLSQDEIAAAEDYRGLKVLRVHTHIPEMGWCLIADIDSKEAFVPVSQLTNTLLLIFAIILLISIFISGYISKTITRPLRRLQEGTEEITKGNLDYKVGTLSSDEVGELSRAFDNMTANLKKTKGELENYSRDLEVKVKVRTRELLDINQSLEKEMIERKLAEKEAELANQAKSAFLASMSHEIRTPMNAIIGMGELMKDTTLNDEQKEYMDMLRISADNLLDVINDVLDISKIESGHIEIEKIEFNLWELIESIGVTLGIKASQKKLELLCYTNPGVPQYIIGDPTRLRQILINLAGNSLKFTEKGEIAINAKILKIEDDKVSLHFTVKDTGIGIPKEKQAKIFENFSQVDSSTTRKYGGTGLGLSICKQLAELMGGKIWVESEINKGSTFHFTLPFVVIEKPEGSEEKVELMEIKNLRVLIVDDNYTNRLILREIIYHWGALPKEAEDGFSALKELQFAIDRKKPYQLILSDKNMPEMDGFELIKRIREIPEYKKVPVIILSSSREEVDLKKIKELNISGFILKPIRRSSLYNAILKAILKETSNRVVQKYDIGPAIKDKLFNILLAEDNLINQKLTIRLLEKQGWKISVANNGKEVLNLFNKNKFDFILMDVQMPEMDGIEATREIRKKEKETGKHIPIIALTANAFKEDKKKCLEAGMDEYATKPIKINELFSIIEKIFIKFKRTI